MNNNLYNILEICIQALENGDNLDAILARYPDQASELRPILETAQQARAMPAPMPSVEAMRRGKARLLQQAAEMREAKRPAPRRQRVIPLFQRLAFATALASVSLLSGTGLVQASSSSLPGENLYPVKRTWEDVRLFFTFSPTVRGAVEGEYEQERLDEVTELLRKGRAASITFSGVVTQNMDGSMMVSGVPVALTASTVFSGDAVTVGSAVIVTGTTDAVGNVSAGMVQVLPSGSVVPTGEMENEDGSGNGTNSNDSPESTFHIEGKIQSINSSVWVIDGQTVYVDDPALLSQVTIGMDVEVKGYFSPDGRFIVTRLEVKGQESEHEEGNSTPSPSSSSDDNNTNSSEDGSSSGSESSDQQTDDKKNDNTGDHQSEDGSQNENTDTHDD